MEDPWGHAGLLQLYIYYSLAVVLSLRSVADPHHLAAAPDPDPDPACHFDEDPDLDPSLQIKAQNLEKVLITLIRKWIRITLIWIRILSFNLMRIRIHNSVVMGGRDQRRGQSSGKVPNISNLAQLRIS